jgi:hypothetical protein
MNEIEMPELKLDASHEQASRPLVSLEDQAQFIKDANSHKPAQAAEPQELICDNSIYGRYAGHGGFPTGGENAGHGGFPTRGENAGHGGFPTRGENAGHGGFPTRGENAGHGGFPTRGENAGHGGFPTKGENAGHGGFPVRNDLPNGGFHRYSR